MSLEEEYRNSPVLVEDSDGGGSVSADFQMCMDEHDEYEELLHYAVVAPKLEMFNPAHLKPLSTLDISAERLNPQRNEDPSQRSAVISAEEKDGIHFSTETPHTSKRVSVLSKEGLHPLPERLGSSCPDHETSVITEMFITEENIGKMENILDTWSNNLTSNVLTELRKWKLTFLEQHKQEMRKERERHAAEAAGLKSELDSLKELLKTYETSSQRKDEVIVNLSQVLDKQKEKLEKMRALTQWRIKHTEAKEEALSFQTARQHYNLQLKRRVWLGWHSLVQKHWKVQVEQACRAKAEEVCSQLSAEYESKLAEHCETIEKAQAEIQRLRLERERYEESMKKAFMRGICALNMEALGMFNSTEGRPERAPSQDQHDTVLPRDDNGYTAVAQIQPHPNPSTQFIPGHFDPSHNQGSSGAPVPPLSTVVHSSLPPGGTAGFQKQVSGRVVTAGQQKPLKTVTARITARTDVAKSSRSKLQVMGVAPPMTSIIVERHHPVTQLTIGQATAARFPLSSQQGQSSAGGRGSSRAPTSTCHVHSIKVVE
ncbi:centrosomal protein POC5 isoform X1 [Takifugu rubripes]|uniref:Centrosomal protein POC5 n=2 Tax=Takifugu rubripes TaxID=31033 RepID=A0A3B5KMW9_TAKRU|nr:centrosomal protein POC5 isoform X1 [Takifugu rubripes]|eukprot:XP_011614163.1 PREDICTED: centrosomal protein POC5 isoform X1 [Takifugu rubripes]